MNDSNSRFDFEQSVKAILAARGMTITELGERLGWSRARTSANVKSHNPSINTMEIICQALGIEVWQLVYGKERLDDEAARRSEVQRITLSFQCPHCGKDVDREIALSKADNLAVVREKQAETEREDKGGLIELSGKRGQSNASNGALDAENNRHAQMYARFLNVMQLRPSVSSNEISVVKYALKSGKSVGTEALMRTAHQLDVPVWEFLTDMEEPPLSGYDLSGETIPELYARLNRLIEERTASVADFCRKADIPGPQFYRMFKAKNNIALKTLNRMASALDLELWQLFVDADEVERERERRRAYWAEHRREEEPSANHQTTTAPPEKARPQGWDDELLPFDFN